MIPDCFSANAVTIMGQLPVCLLILHIIVYHGTNIDSANPLPKEYMLLGAFCIQWFTFFDIMDGNRARRLKVGSPLGRMIDEGGDTITQSAYCVLLAYAWQLNNGAFEIVILSFNFIFFSMEMKYTITKKLVMAVGDDFGPVELELIFSIFLALMGVYGNDMSGYVAHTFGWNIESKCPLHYVGRYQWIEVLGVVLCFV